MKTTIAITVALIIGSANAVQADGCNIADVLFGKVRIEIVRHKDKDLDFEIGIIFGDDFDSKKFQYGKILGQIAEAERDGSRAVSDVNNEPCGIIEENLTIDTSDGNCDRCGRELNLRKVPPNSYIVMRNGNEIVGSISGRLNK